MPMTVVEVAAPSPMRYMMGAAVMMIGVVLPLAYMMFRNKRVPSSSSYSKQTLWRHTQNELLEKRNKEKSRGGNSAIVLQEGLLAVLIGSYPSSSPTFLRIEVHNSDN
ncbi:hypothetical protein KY290_034671 [Solanum tuberosum]|uniref:Transmembrane protein n=2 Tax=Solanum tuberosum TaxID=4113 RepID=A0ABQ7U4E7_SOLTU|nr:hypothetical protein KY289_034040 [Solanum tuberosum]KAH0648655.1 hypothetical protein KY285_033903 [Solanum tuberosum]KAH0741628.1 hypothetical protein KY290_034671 [Solanum tuberosum]